MTSTGVFVRRGPFLPFRGGGDFCFSLLQRSGTAPRGTHNPEIHVRLMALLLVTFFLIVTFSTADASAPLYDTGINIVAVTQCLIAFGFVHEHLIRVIGFGANPGFCHGTAPPRQHDPLDLGSLRVAISRRGHSALRVPPRTGLVLYTFPARTSVFGHSLSAFVHSAPPMS